LLVRLDKAHFTALLESSAPLSMALTRHAMQRLKTEHQIAHHAAPVTIGLMAVTEGFDLGGFADELAVHLSKHGRVCRADRSLLEADGDGAGTFSLALDALESQHDFVLLVADPQPSAWTERCRRHCDELLLLADATQPPALHTVEQAGQTPRPAHSQAAEVLVLVHPPHTQSPQGTAAWLNRRPVADHVHLRAGQARDLARLARLISRTAVGLVLAGGGARGFAHLGVLQVLQEQGVEVDCVGGTSIGSIMAALAAADEPLVRTIDIAREVFSSNPTGDYNPLPLISLVRGGRRQALTRRALRSLVGGFDPDAEDLWKSFFAIATNYSLAREEVLVRGPLQSVLLASAAIPGALPPVVLNGSLLCDGGTFNNFPVDVMKARRGIGCVIGFDLGQRQPRHVKLAEMPGPWALLRDRLRPRRARRYRLPSLATLLLNSTILFSVSRQESAQRLTDVYLNPPLFKVGMLQWKRFDSVVQQGAQHAREVLSRPEVAKRLGCQPAQGRLTQALAPVNGQEGSAIPRPGQGEPPAPHHP
jgi:NTE family protein